jgi:hypothetical protein
MLPGRLISPTISTVACRSQTVLRIQYSGLESHTLPTELRNVSFSEQKVLLELYISMGFALIVFHHPALYAMHFVTYTTTCNVYKLFATGLSITA